MRRNPAVLAVVVLAVAGCEPEVPLSGGGGGVTGTTRQPAVDMPALWGSSVTPLANGRVAIADPESDTVFLASADGSRQRIVFPPGSRPTRVVVAGSDLGVLLRGSGQVARVKASGSTVRESGLNRACSEARGLAYDEKDDALVVACATGELVTLDGSARSVVQTGLELRDVLFAGGKRWVTTFRTPALVEIGADGHTAAELAPPEMPLAQVKFTPRVAWRTIADGNRVVMVHQLHLLDEVTKLTNPAPTQPYYGKPYCTASVVSAAITVFDAKTGNVQWSRPIIGSLPVDVAVKKDRIAVAFAGAGRVLEFAVGDTVPAAGVGGCLYPVEASEPGTPLGVGYVEGELQWMDQSGRLKRPQWGNDDDTELVTPRTLDDARTLFHAESPSGVSCASCHPDGFDDGHTWQFGPRRVRSQSLEGGLLATAPFHWDGKLSAMRDVLDETFVSRMGGLKPDTSQAEQLGAWLDQLPARESPESVDARAAKRGAVIFERAQCGTCHAGSLLTNDATVDVGTGAAFQVPSLKALRWRGPWMHDGCAKTLEQRFDPACGGAKHGAAVASDEVPDLVEYLKTL